MKGNYILKTFTCVLGILQAALYTPIVLSFALFILIIPMLFVSGLANPLLRLFPDGYYTTQDILAIYGKYAFGISLVIAFAEMILNKRFTISVKKKVIWLASLLFVGYIFVFAFLVAKAKLGLENVLIFVIPFFVLSILATLLSGLLSSFINFLNNFFDQFRNTPSPN